MKTKTQSWVSRALIATALAGTFVLAGTGAAMAASAVSSWKSVSDVPGIYLFSVRGFVDNSVKNGGGTAEVSNYSSVPPDTWVSPHSSSRTE